MAAIPSPLDLLRALPHLGVNLIIPALVIGAVQGSMVDIFMGFEGWPVTKLGLLLGPLCFGLAINALHRCEAARKQDWVALSEAYRQAETARRRDAAVARGELIAFRRPPRP